MQDIHNDLQLCFFNSGHPSISLFSVQKKPVAVYFHPDALSTVFNHMCHATELEIFLPRSLGLSQSSTQMIARLKVNVMLTVSCLDVATNRAVNILPSVKVAQPVQSA